jgi:AcrR family transcriptional regulator
MSAIAKASHRTPLQPRRGKRGQGRPTQADPEITKALIVAATRELLRHMKPARITREAVARAARVDPGLVRYYFGNTSSLFTHVIRKIGDDLHARLDALSPAANALDQLRDQAAVWLQVFMEDPHFHELVVDRIFHGEDRTAVEMLSRFVERAYPRFDRLISAGTRRGELRKVDPRFVYLAFIGLCEFFATAGPLVERLFGDKGAAARFAPAYGRFVADLLADGLRKREEG